MLQSIKFILIPGNGYGVKIIGISKVNRFYLKIIFEDVMLFQTHKIIIIMELVTDTATSEHKS